MAVITTGITVVVVQIDPGSVLVTWSSTNSTKCHQIYHNQRLIWFDTEAKTTGSLPVLVTPGVRHIFEMLAVDPDECSVDFSGSLTETNDNVKVLRFVADPNLWAIDDQAEFYIEETGNAAPDYIAANLKEEKPIFPDGAFYWGYGFGGYGAGTYGYGGANSIGFGNGPFGQGGFGFGADWSSHVTEPLNPGTYKAAARIQQPDGDRDAGAIDVETLTIVGPPRPPANLTPTVFAGSGGSRTLTCTFTESPDLP